MGYSPWGHKESVTNDQLSTYALCMVTSTEPFFFNLNSISALRLCPIYVLDS